MCVAVTADLFVRSAVLFFIDAVALFGTSLNTLFETINNSIP